MASYKTPVDIKSHMVIGTFSTDEEMNYCDDLRNRRFFIEPDNKRPNFDLTYGLNEFVDRKPSGNRSTSLSPILEWMRDHRDELIEKGILVAQEGDNDYSKRLNVDFVSRCDVLSRLLQAATNVDKVDILVTRCNGTYYIEHLKETDFETFPKEMIFAGRKFLQYVTSADGGPPDTTEPVNASASYYSVTRAKCGVYSLLFTSETQAERKESTKRPPYNYVAIKSTKPRIDKKTKSAFKKFKSAKWWSKAHLAGIPEILCGIRDDAAHVITSVELMQTGELPRQSGRLWNTVECLVKFYTLLGHIQNLIRDDNPKVVYHLELEPVEKNSSAKGCLINRLFTQHGPKGDDYVIVPDWYLRQVLDKKE